MADIHHLEDKMRSLKLTGMLDTLDLRLSQTQKDGLGFTHFLELLLEDEVQHQANKKLASRITKAHFKEEKSLEAFDFNFNPKVPARYIRDLATCQFIERRESIISCGPVGVSKTHLTQVQGIKPVVLATAYCFAKLVGSCPTLEAAELMIPGEKRLRRYLKPDLLIIDDFALKEFTKSQGEDLYELIDQRYRSSSMMVTASRSPKDWHPLFPNPVIAECARPPHQLLSCYYSDR